MKPLDTIYAGKKEAVFNTFPTSTGSSYTRDTTGNQGTTETAIGTMKDDYVNNGSATTNSSVATFQLTSDPSAWLSFSLSPSFGVYQAFESNITSAATGNNGHAVDLFQIKPDDNTPGTLAPTYEGRFVIDNTGTITYTSAGSVPEPSTLAALLGGAGFLGLIRRRRTTTV
jgi:hypothetical protein